jgi:hypothetical protein
VLDFLKDLNQVPEDDFEHQWHINTPDGSGCYSIGEKNELISLGLRGLNEFDWDKLDVQSSLTSLYIRDCYSICRSALISEIKSMWKY